MFLPQSHTVKILVGRQDVSLRVEVSLDVSPPQSVDLPELLAGRALDEDDLLPGAGLGLHQAPRLVLAVQHDVVQQGGGLEAGQAQDGGQEVQLGEEGGRPGWRDVGWVTDDPRDPQSSLPRCSLPAPQGSVTAGLAPPVVQQAGPVVRGEDHDRLVVNPGGAQVRSGQVRSGQVIVGSCSVETHLRYFIGLIH